MDEIKQIKCECCGDVLYIKNYAVSRGIPTEYEWKKERFELLNKTTLAFGAPEIDERCRLEKWLKENKPEKWVTCTKDNTQIGDEVRLISNKSKTRKIDFIYGSGSRVIITYLENGYQTNALLGSYEINLHGKDKE